MTKYNIARLGAGNIDHLRALYKAVYGKDCGVAYFSMKYDTAYTGAQYTGYIAYDGHTPVAYYGVVPMLVSMQGKPVLAAQSCDTMTHPAYRRQGLFIELAQQAFVLARQEGIHLVFGFPNQHSYPGFIRHLGFVHQHTMMRYTFRFPGSLYHKLHFKVWQTFAAKNPAGISNPLLQEGFDGIIYNDAWLAYKRYSPSHVLNTTQGTAWLKAAHGLWTGTVNLNSRHHMRSLIQDLAKKTKAAEITLMISPGTMLNEQLEKCAEPQQGFAVIIKNLSGAYQTNRFKFQLSDIDIF